MFLVLVCSTCPRSLPPLPHMCVAYVCASGMPLWIHTFCCLSGCTGWQRFSASCCLRRDIETSSFHRLAPLTRASRRTVAGASVSIGPKHHLGHDGSDGPTVPWGDAWKLPCLTERLSRCEPRNICLKLDCSKKTTPGKPCPKIQESG